MHRLTHAIQNFAKFLLVYSIPKISSGYVGYKGVKNTSLTFGLICNPILDALQKDDISLEKNVDLYEPISYYCREKGIEEATLYKEGNFDKSVLTKIRNMRNSQYLPQKNILIRICLVLRLNHDQTLEMLDFAGYTLAEEIPADKIISFAIQKGFYDWTEIDDAIHQKTGRYYLATK